jgi:hypothetical protein
MDNFNEDFKPVEFLHPMQANDTGASFLIISANTGACRSHTPAGMRKQLQLASDIRKHLSKEIVGNKLTKIPQVSTVMGIFEGDIELSLALDFTDGIWMDAPKVWKLLKRYNQRCALYVHNGNCQFIFNGTVGNVVGKWRELPAHLIGKVEGYTMSIETGIQYYIDGGVR